MYSVLVWNDLQGDFIYFRDPTTGKQWIGDEQDAMTIALMFIGRGVQARTTYVRKQFIDKPKNKKPRAGRIKRFQTAMLDGERVKILATVNSAGKLVK